MKKINILNVSREELTALLLENGSLAKAYHPMEIFRWIYRKNVLDFSLMSNISKSLRLYLDDHFEFKESTLEKVYVDKIDNTKKLLIRLKDGLRVESVIIPSEKRVTLCISSQVGCKRACKFCRTALMKLKRNLEVSEILDQLRFALKVVFEDEGIKKDSPYLITNIVFMGMGEPLDNLENVGRAIEIMEDQAAFGYSKRRITVSTCGVLDTLLSLPGWGDPNLAISLNAADDSARDKIMPVNRKFPLHRLFSVLKKYPLDRGRRITFEYILISGLNDNLEDAQKLVNLLKRVPSKVNLLNLNEFENLPLARSSEEKVEAFRNHLLKNGIQTNVRPSRGLSIWAACGQLASQTDVTEKRR